MLKQCPCGQTPKELIIHDGLDGSFVGGNCCQEWFYFFDSKSKDGEELYKLMVEAWNNQERG
jgi:hypothetical protein